MADGVRTALKLEILLQINERLYRRGVVSRDLYEQAKVRLAQSGRERLSCLRG